MVRCRRIMRLRMMMLGMLLVWKMRWRGMVFQDVAEDEVEDDVEENEDEDQKGKIKLRMIHWKRLMLRKTK